MGRSFYIEMLVRKPVVSHITNYIVGLRVALSVLLGTLISLDQDNLLIDIAGVLGGRAYLHSGV